MLECWSILHTRHQILNFRTHDLMLDAGYKSVLVGNAYECTACNPGQYKKIAGSDFECLECEVNTYRYVVSQTPTSSTHQPYCHCCYYHARLQQPFCACTHICMPACINYTSIPGDSPLLPVPPRVICSCVTAM